MKKILSICLTLLPLFSLAQNLTNTSVINITKSWSQEPTGYTYPIQVKVPTGTAPQDGFPVCILLHGNGGNGGGMINQFSGILECHALVAPSGYQNSWNICSENSDAPDVEMVNDLIDILQAYANINSNKIRIIGSSNGAGLANNVFIKNQNAGLDLICAIVTHLNIPQYHLNEFYYPSNTTNPSENFCAYDVVSTPLSTTKYLSISNENDPIIPYDGGSSVVGVDFLPAETAAYNIAVNHGYSGPQLASGNEMGNPQITEYSYLSGKVVHIKGDAQHATNISQREYIKNYFSDCETLVGVNTLGKDKVKIYPNPTPAKLRIEFNESTPSSSLRIYNKLGQVIFRQQLFGTDKSTDIDLSHLTNGIYFLEVSNKNGFVFSEKIIKL